MCLLRSPGRRRTVILASRYPASEDGLVNQLALLREGRIAMHARRDELDERGDDLPCPWCYGPTYEEDTRCSGCGRSFG